MENLYDVIIVGGGPAGLTAALYLARARYRALVIERENFGGQITITEDVVNYPGVIKTSGKELTKSMRIQAQNFGAEFLNAEVNDLDLNEDIKTVRTSKGEFKSFGVVIATGASPRMTGFKGEKEYKGRGVAYCATCDGEFFKGKDVFVVGGGFAAAEESVFLTRFASHVTILIREEDFTCAKATADLARNNDNITIYTNTEVVEAAGDEFLRTLTYKNNITGEITKYKAPNDDTYGIFVFAGYEPQVALVKDKVRMTDNGYIWTDVDKKTNINGVYAAGDVCDKVLRQVVTATSDGAVAATELEKYVANMHKKTGIIPQVKSVELNSDKKSSVDTTNESGGIFDSDIVNSLKTVFEKMENSLILELCLDDRTVSDELESYVKELVEYTDKLDIKVNKDINELLPCVRVLDKEGKFTGMSFHGVFGGHEFTSFILGLYNISGPGQPIAPEVRDRVEAIDKNIDIKLLVSLSCTMCPDLVIAAWRIGALSDKVDVKTFDINHFGELKDKYKVMSVPCMIINDEHVYFGKKNIEQILDIIDTI